jgi:hypothetical protein
MESSDESNKGFFKHVFNFDDDSKSEILNTLQYILLAIIPVVILNKSIGRYLPEADDKKGSIEITAEILIQIIITFLGLLLVHRIITYVPTYSNTKYPDFHIIFIVLAILMITMSLQTKLGEKVSILVDRISELWNGKCQDNGKKNQKGSGNVKVFQPISGQQQNGAMNGQQQIGPITGQPSFTQGTSISSLPTYEQQQTTSNSGTQQLPDYNSMYKQDTTPLVGASTPGQGSSNDPGQGLANEPIAANEGFGAFGSAW